MGRLTTHILDLAAGKPAAGVLIELFRAESPDQPLAALLTNADGRVERPLLEGAALRPGVYELRFHAGDYLRSSGAQPKGPLFLDVIPIRFGVASADEHYHVPLLLSPFGYSTYRGS